MSAKVKLSANGYIEFWCPGCDEEHQINVNPGRWTWNGNPESPTFKPSVLVRSGHFVEERGNKETCWCTYAKDHPKEEDLPRCHRCHSFVTDGKIQFLADSSHSLAGKTVDLPGWNEMAETRNKKAES